MLKTIAMSVGLLVGFSAMGADWPAFRGPNADGISPETGINKDWGSKAPKELWRIALSDEGYGGQAVADGKLYFIDHKGDKDYVRCLSMADGKELWTYSYADADKPNYGFTRSTPTVANGKVYTVSNRGRVNCLNAASGELVWSVDMVKELGGSAPGWGFSASVLVDGERAIVIPGGDERAVVALNVADGKVIWKGGSDKASYATPVLATINGRRQYVVFTGTQVAGYAPEDGKLIWKFPWKTSYDVHAAVPLIIGDSVFISSAYGTGCAMVDVSADGAKQRWRNKVLQQHFSSAIVHEGMIYGTTDPGDLVCMDAKSGNELWRQKGFEKGGIVGVDGAILALSGNSGELVMVEMAPGKCTELGRIKPLGGQSWTTPIVADGKVLVRNNQALVCLSLQ